MARRGKFGKAALLMGAAAVAAGVLLKREKVAGLLGQGALGVGQAQVVVGQLRRPAGMPSDQGHT
ncbi:MAG: hypothetical protein ACRDPU_13590 [Thermoleophilia bacterium]